MKKKLSVDRVEEGIAVCFDDDGNEYRIEYPVSEGDVLDADIDNSGNVTVIGIDEIEKQRREKANTNRLKALFGREKRGN